MHSNAKKKDRFRSGLEGFAFEQLTLAGIEFGYETLKIELVPAFSLESKVLEGKGSKFSEQSPKVRPITYTPDFVGSYWMMETKGRRTPDFDLKWKLFKRFLHENNIQLLILLPRNQKQVLACIDLILEHGKQNRVLLRKYKGKQLPSFWDAKSKVHTPEKDETGAVRRRRQKLL